ncbi:MAG: c-type cytochrome [Acidobacteriaceae bacterium]|nr:c-type cytochrome [Acidobacteriaceae bacterium]
MDRPIPRTGFVTAGLLCVVSFLHLSARGQGQSEVGQQLFSSTCAACHGLDGRGGEHAPNIATSANVQQLSDQDLTRIVSNGIPAAGMPGFRSSLNKTQIDAVIKYVRSLQGQDGAVSVPGDPDRGRVLFFGKARCSQCHMIRGEGGFLAADLSGYGKTHSPAAIRESIVDPNKNLDPRHGTVIVVTLSGKKYTGVVRNEDNFSLQMQTADGNFHFFDKSELVRIDYQKQSSMPSTYGTELTSANLDDLVCYLVKTPGTPPAPAEKNDDE